MTPLLLAQLAEKYDTELAGKSLEILQAEWFSYADFRAFLQTYRVVCTHLRGTDDYLLLLKHLVEQLQRQNVVYAEVIYTPSIPWRFERDGREVLEALLDYSRNLLEQKGPRIQWILDCVRQFGGESARQTGLLASRFRERGVVALGLGGDELARPIRQFEEAFSAARREGLKLHVHAGETGPPGAVQEAVEVLGANRIGHGIAAAQDPGLMWWLAQKGVTLDVCLTSNERTGAVALDDHPLPVLVAGGVPVTLSTDDPGMFETTLMEEYELAYRRHGLDIPQIVSLIRQSFQSAFLPPGERQKFDERLTQALKKNK